MLALEVTSQAVMIRAAVAVMKEYLYKTEIYTFIDTRRQNKIDKKILLEKVLEGLGQQLNGVNII